MSDWYTFGDLLLVFEDMVQDSEKVLVPFDVSWCNAKSIDISIGSVNTQSIRSELKNLTSRVVDDVLWLVILAAAFFDPVNHNLSKPPRDRISGLPLFFILKLVIVLS